MIIQFVKTQRIETVKLAIRTFKISLKSDEADDEGESD
jgi:hypothetical protein